MLINVTWVCDYKSRLKCRARLKRFAPLNDSDQHHNDCDNQQDMNESANRVTANQPQQPKYHEHYKNRPKHSFLPSGNKSAYLYHVID
jgi:hypothetical protein